jgi:hypothetical protein
MKKVKVYAVYVKLEKDGKTYWKRAFSHPRKERALQTAEAMRKVFPIEDLEIRIVEEEEEG